ncbi:uncharacterized protein [Dysidea avara]|uniref:uncharacterized protein n=1 Tax=Dysidea avara TaxID=196820 RepID=UPI00331DCE49
MAIRYLLAIFVLASVSESYYVGVGRYDITGPAAGINMMGYANPSQISNGIHLRQWSRAFIFAESSSSERVVFVNIDVCMTTQIMKLEVVKRLKALYGTTYTEDNVCISGIHTHSGPGGYWQYVLYEVTSLGFVKQSLDVVVDGIVESIKLAHHNMKQATLLTSVGSLTNASINRSPYAYEQNPDKGNYDANVDHTMFVLKMIDSSKNPLGMISWFAVHCTSMNNTNGLISADNKGYASLLTEMSYNKGQLPGQGEFVAAHSQSNEGDVSPNTKGPICIDTGKPCDYKTSTCNGRNEKCIASGPGKDMVDSTRIIAENQYYFGKTLFENASNPVSGPVDFKHSYVDMTKVMVKLENGTEVKTCPPAMGYSFAAGTVDGPGAFNFEQGDNGTGHTFWNIVRNRLHKPGKDQIECHHPKPILLDIGDMTVPYQWAAAIVPVQILRIGQLFILGVPGEFSTMAGRRLRDNVKKTLQQNGVTGDIEVVIAGLANTYADYITTPEEYSVQRYEGASTIYGPYTLVAYIQEFNKLAVAIAKGQSVDKGPEPPNDLSKQWSLVPRVLYDSVPIGKKFGEVEKDVKPSYARGNSTVVVSFYAGHPRNGLMTGKTFLTVEYKSTNSDWKVVHTDASWETRFRWKHTSEITGESLATVEWDIPSSALTGTYRIQHFGNHKNVLEKITPYTGVSSQFQVM